MWEKRLLERRWRCVQRTASMTALIILAASCRQCEIPPEIVPDAAPSGYAVRGRATGVLEPVELQLTHPGGTEILLVSGDGPFVFEARLAQGEAYTVQLLGSPPCVLENENGTIDSAEPEVVVTCAGAAVLTSLILSGPTAPAVNVLPAQTEYEVEVSLLQQSVTITPVALRPEATITVAGAPVASGMPSQELPLALGANEIELVVAHPSGRQQSYRVIIHRAAALAQYAYGRTGQPDPGDELGRSVALSGDLLAVGTPFEDSSATGVGGNQDDNAADASGAVFVFRRTGAVWAQEAYLKASNTGAGDVFGFSVALEGDTLAVGAPFEDSSATSTDGNQDDNSAPESGAVYVFRRGDATWTQEAYVKASNTDAYDGFGTSVALSGDTLAVGTPWEDSAVSGVDGNQDDDSAENSGAVYVFRRGDATWTQEAYLKASNTDAYDGLGWSVALSGDTLAAGAFGEDSATTGIDGNQDDDSTSESGAVYVFRRADATWAQEAYVKASNTGVYDRFGWSVALSGDALAVGAPYEDSAAAGVDGDQNDDSAEWSGAVYVYRRVNTTWAQEAYVKASNPDAYDWFGSSVALVGDVLAVGAPSEASAATGIDGDQGDNSTAWSGAAYLFLRTGDAWAQAGYLKALHSGAHKQLGSSVALSNDTLATGAPYEDHVAAGSGAVYVFH